MRVTSPSPALKMASPHKAEKTTFFLKQMSKYKCFCGKCYETRSGLWKHKKKCLEADLSVDLQEFDFQELTVVSDDFSEDSMIINGSETFSHFQDGLNSIRIPNNNIQDSSTQSRSRAKMREENYFVHQQQDFVNEGIIQQQQSAVSPVNANYRHYLSKKLAYESNYGPLELSRLLSRIQEDYKENANIQKVRDAYELAFLDSELKLSQSLLIDDQQFWNYFNNAAAISDQRQICTPTNKLEPIQRHSLILKLPLVLFFVCFSCASYWIFYFSRQIDK